MSKADNLTYYNDKAVELAKSYDGLKTPDVLEAFCEAVKKLPKTAHARRALDIGCGSGRDAVWLAEQGYKVTAVDGSAEMLKEAAHNQNHKDVEYVLDTAPELNKLIGSGQKFEVILMSAFIFHFDKSAREKIFKAMQQVAAENCLFYVSVRSPNNSSGRSFYEVKREEIETFAKEGNFDFRPLGQMHDKLARNAVSWQHYILNR